MRATSHLPAAHAPAPLACAQLVPVLKGLGARHAKYGVEAAHYPVVGSAFLKTLSVGLGDAYTEEVAAAYTAMWTVVADTMQAGAAEAAAAEPPAAAEAAAAEPPCDSAPPPCEGNTTDKPPATPRSSSRSCSIL